MMSRWVVSCSVSGVLLIGLSVKAQAPISANLAARKVPTALVNVAALGKVADLAHGLAASRIAAGLVIRKAETGRLDRTRHDYTVTNANLGEAIQAFLRLRTDYVSQERAGAVFLMPSMSRCAQPLEARVPNIRFSGEAFATAFYLFKAIQPGVTDVPPGIVSSHLGDGPVPDVAPLTNKLDLRLANGTILEAMQEAVKQAPGLVWSVIEDVNPTTNRPRCVVRWFLDQATVATSYDFAAK